MAEILLRPRFTLGKVFSSQDTHFRISYATTDEKLAAGCDILCDIAG